MSWGDGHRSSQYSDIFALYRRIASRKRQKRHVSQMGRHYATAYTNGTFFFFLHFIIITKTRLFKYIENFTSKNWKFSDKKLWIFFYISTKKHRCEAVLTSTHNLCFWAEIRKIMYTPVNPSFSIWKWGLKGSKLYRYVFVMFASVLIIST